MNDLPEIVGLQELADLLEVGPRTPHAWQYRKLLPTPDFDSINGLRAWKIDTILQWAADTGRVTDRLRPFAPAARPGADVKGGRATAKAKPEPKTEAEVVEDASPSADAVDAMLAASAGAAAANEAAGPGVAATWTVRDEGEVVEAEVEVLEPEVSEPADDGEVPRPEPIHASGFTFERGPDGRLRQVGG